MMAKKLSTAELKAMVKLAECVLCSEVDRETRVVVRDEIKSLKRRIAQRERYEAMRDMGMVKTPYGWE